MFTIFCTNHNQISVNFCGLICLYNNSAASKSITASCSAHFLPCSASRMLYPRKKRQVTFTTFLIFRREVSFLTSPEISAISLSSPSDRRGDQGGRGEPERAGGDRGPAQVQALRPARAPWRRRRRRRRGEAPCRWRRRNPSRPTSPVKAEENHASVSDGEFGIKCWVEG